MNMETALHMTKGAQVNLHCQSAKGFYSVSMLAVWQAKNTSRVGLAESRVPKLIVLKV
jgi:hypothetical protein